MSDLLIRKATPADIDQLVRLWQLVFEDDIRFIHDFLTLLPDCGYGMVAVENKDIVSMAFVLRDLHYKGHSCSYLYAVATHPQFRGKGISSNVLLTCVKQENESGIPYIFTAPAEPSLFPWYEKNIHALPSLTCTERYTRRSDHSASISTLTVEKINIGQYLKERESILLNIDHIQIGPKYGALLQRFLEDYDGGLYRIGNSLAAGYPDNGALHCQELLSDANSDADSVMVALMDYFRSDSARCRIPGKTSSYIAAVPPGFPNSSIWFGLILD